MCQEKTVSKDVSSGPLPARCMCNGTCTHPTPSEKKSYEGKEYFICPCCTGVISCEHCGEPVMNIDNIGHMCAYQMDDHTVLNAQNGLFCTCCDECRGMCHQGKFEQDNESNTTLE